jgi:hypothetical protein
MDEPEVVETDPGCQFQDPESGQICRRKPTRRVAIEMTPAPPTASVDPYLASEQGAVLTAPRCRQHGGWPTGESAD